MLEFFSCYTATLLPALIMEGNGFTLKLYNYVLFDMVYYIAVLLGKSKIFFVLLSQTLSSLLHTKQ